jgi:hypothetical protein
VSSIFQETATALANDSEVRARVLSVTTAEERAALLRQVGVPVPTREDVNAHSDATLKGVAGGGETTQGAAAAAMDAAGAAAA